MRVDTTRCPPEIKMAYHSRTTTRRLSTELRSRLLIVCSLTITLLLFVFPPPIPYNTILISTDYYQANTDNPRDLETILKHASMDDNTVIVTTINDAWSAPNSMFDLLLESFRIGNETERLLKHLVVVCLDQIAYDRCLKLHPHCYNLETSRMNFTGEASFMTTDYLKMMWRRLNLLRDVLDLGYSFVFTDADIMWFRDPFTEFHEDVDFQITCDYFNGNSSDLNNSPNGGFNYVKSNDKTIEFYKFWYDSRLTYPGLHDQEVFNIIKFNPFINYVGLQIRFLDTAYFGGFCQSTLDLTKLCTMHANCCSGLETKVHDLGILLNDWRNYTKSLVINTTKYTSNGYWTSIPHLCRADHL